MPILAAPIGITMEVEGGIDGVAAKIAAKIAEVAQDRTLTIVRDPTEGGFLILELQGTTRMPLNRKFATALRDGLTRALDAPNGSPEPLSATL